eukprot:15159587-Ditylum_brightwellii.AAC.1
MEHRRSKVGPVPKVDPKWRLQHDERNKKIQILYNEIDCMKIRDKEKKNVEDLTSTIYYFEAVQTMKILLVQSSQIIKHLEKQGSLPKKTKENKKQGKTLEALDEPKIKCYQSILDERIEPTYTERNSLSVMLHVSDLTWKETEKLCEKMSKNARSLVGSVHQEGKYLIARLQGSLPKNYKLEPVAKQEQAVKNSIIMSTTVHILATAAWKRHTEIWEN